jgi:hypothetical protein
MSILGHLELKLEELLVERNKLVEVDNQALIHGSNI